MMPVIWTPRVPPPLLDISTMVNSFCEELLLFITFEIHPLFVASTRSLCSSLSKWTTGKEITFAHYEQCADSPIEVVEYSLS